MKAPGGVRQALCATCRPWALCLEWHPTLRESIDHLRLCFPTGSAAAAASCRGGSCRSFLPRQLPFLLEVTSPGVRPVIAVMATVGIIAGMQVLLASEPSAVDRPN